MGLFDVISREGRAKSSVGRQIRRVMNKHLQSADRFPALHKLRDLGTDEAIFGLAKRFSYVYDKTIEDEQEKEWVSQTLIEMGEKAISSLRRYARESETLSYPLGVFERIAKKEVLLEIVDELLSQEEPGYTRNPTRKIQILTWLAEWKGASADEASRRIVPYLADFDETVRFVAVEALSHQKHETTARNALLDAMLRPEEESRRIKVRIADVLAAAGWTVTNRKEEVSRLLSTELPEFGMQHEKLVRKKER